MNTPYGHSSFWLGDTDDSTLRSVMSTQELQNYDLYKLAANKKAISNFVSILTGKQIPVHFVANGNSCTDSKTVYISSNLEKGEDFDVACGLSLHEASHILLSDFDILQGLKTWLETNGYYSDLETKANQLGIPVLSTLKMITNVVEDRRIDRYIYDTAPGYRSYYTALYDKYFNDKLIDKLLQSDEYTNEDFESYEVRLINIHSKFTRLDALKGLPAIYKELDLKNISRLKDTFDALKVAINIFHIILSSISVKSTDDSLNQDPQLGEGGQGESGQDEENSPSNSGSDEENKDEQQSPSNSGSDDEDDDDEGENEESTETASNIESSNNGKHSPDSDEKDETRTKNKSDVELTDRQKETVKKKIEKQRKFIKGEVSKRKLKKADIAEIDLIDKTDSEIVTVATGEDSDFSANGIDVVFVKKLTEELLHSRSFPFAGGTWALSHRTENVENGIRLGSMLGKKLQIRSEQRETVFNRQRTGKLDKRMIATLGFGSENVFYHREIDSFNSVNLHMSIDASSSMGGSKWDNAIINAVAISKAVDMIPNLNLQISMRGTTKNRQAGDIPYIVIVYDSRVDKFSKIRKMFPYLYPWGTTPEGLTFEAISKYITSSSNSLDSVFLNISDGEPYFPIRGNNSYRYERYSGSPAAKQTYGEIKKMKARGIKVISYLVGASSNRIFQESYGDTAKYINIENMNEVSKTINQLFLTK